nr:hypothetical protein [uncultured Mediterranean phage uvMED]
MMSTPTSRKHLVLFKKENCPPCGRVAQRLESIISREPDLVHQISVLRKEYHSALLAAYDIDLFPTMLLVDSYGEELDRWVGGTACFDALHEELKECKAMNL